MSQLNVNLNPDFERDLSDFMLIRGIQSKSEAVRVAIHEGLMRSRAEHVSCDFAEWLGAAVGLGENPRPKFRNHAELWTPRF